jgi:hypothetical protein
MKVILLNDQLHEYMLYMMQKYMGVANLEELEPLKDLFMATKNAQDLPIENMSEDLLGTREEMGGSSE